MGRDESVNIVIDGDRIGVLSTGNAGDKSDGKVRKKVSTDDGYTFVESELTEEELAKRLGYGSVKALKLALVNEDDYIRFMNSGNAFNDNIRHGIAAENKGVYDKAAGITGFAGSFLPGYGDGIDVKETITGEDARTGEKLPLWQRGVTGAAMLLPIVSGGTIRSVIKGSDEVSEIAEQTIKHGDELIQGAGKSLKPQNLMDELAQSGVKYAPEDVVTVTKTPDGRLMWLENGNGSSGLKHILDGHATDFANRGINDIPGFLNKTLQETPFNIGKGIQGPFADFMINGSNYRIVYGTNGYVVTFFPIK